LHVDDLTEEILRAIKWANPGLNFFNLSPIDTISVKEIVKLFLQITNWDVPVKYQDTDFGWVGDVPSYSFDLSDGSGLPASSKKAIAQAIIELHSESRFR
jgi:UDP-glucose 4-epimerase